MASGMEMLLINALKAMGVDAASLQQTMQSFGGLVEQLNRMEAKQDEILALLRGDIPVINASVKETQNATELVE